MAKIQQAFEKNSLEMLASHSCTSMRWITCLDWDLLTGEDVGVQKVKAQTELSLSNLSLSRFSLLPSVSWLHMSGFWRTILHTVAVTSDYWSWCLSRISNPFGRSPLTFSINKIRFELLQHDWLVIYWKQDNTEINWSFILTTKRFFYMNGLFLNIPFCPLKKTLMKILTFF